VRQSPARTAVPLSMRSRSWWPRALLDARSCKGGLPRHPSATRRHCTQTRARSVALWRS